MVFYQNAQMCRQIDSFKFTFVIVWLSRVLCYDFPDVMYMLFRVMQEKRESVPEFLVLIAYLSSVDSKKPAH